MKKKSLILPATFLASAILIGLVTTAYAGISVSPLKQEISLKPGDSGKVAITVSDIVRDDQAQPQALHFEVTDVLVSQEGALSLPAPSTQHDSASKWITLPSDDITLTPGKAEVFEATITPPFNTPPGEYYSSILVSLARKDKTAKGVIVQYRVASGVFVTVLGRTLSKQAKIKSSEIIWPAAPATQPAPTPDSAPADVKPSISIILQNTGRGRFDGSGKLRIFDTDLHLIYKTALTSNRPCVFAGDSRLFEAVMSKPLHPGHYLAKVDMDYESSWSSAHAELQLDVTPEQAAAWAHAATHSLDDNAVVEAGLEKIACTLLPGSSRNYAAALRNISESPVHAIASLPSEKSTLPASWISFGSDEFTIGKAGRLAVPIGIQVPPDTQPGIYSTHLIVQAGPLGLPLAQQISIPIDLEVRAEKH